MICLCKGRLSAQAYLYVYNMSRVQLRLNLSQSGVLTMYFDHLNWIRSNGGNLSGLPCVRVRGRWQLWFSLCFQLRTWWGQRAGPFPCRWSDPSSPLLQRGSQAERSDLGMKRTASKISQFFSIWTLPYNSDIIMTSKKITLVNLPFILSDPMISTWCSRINLFGC